MRLFARTVLLAMMATGMNACASDSPWIYGIHWFGDSNNNADVRDMAEGKPIWTLETIMTNEGNTGWGPQAQLARMENIVAQGHTIICRVEPKWGRAFPLPGDTDPSMEEFLDQVSAMAELYKDVCHIWQLGNEMNLTIEWDGQELPPATYIEAAAKFSDRIHAVKSSLGPQIVLVGPVSPGPVWEIRWMSSTDYINGMCEAINNKGYRGKFQGFSMHAYANPETMDVDECLYQFEREPGSGYQDQVQLLDKHGFEDYPVYITEWNRKVNEINAPTEHVSARFLQRAFVGMNEWNQSGGHPIVCACWFVYQDFGGNWENYAIRSLKNQEGPDQDVWHAFEAAAKEDFPAAYPEGYSPGRANSNLQVK